MELALRLRHDTQWFWCVYYGRGFKEQDIIVVVFSTIVHTCTSRGFKEIMFLLSRFLSYYTCNFIEKSFCCPFFYKLRRTEISKKEKCLNVVFSTIVDTRKTEFSKKKVSGVNAFNSHESVLTGVVGREFRAYST